MDGGTIICEPVVDGDFVAGILAGRITEDESLRFARQPAEVIAFTLLAIQKRLGESSGDPAAGPNTPSAAVLPYAKPAAAKSKNKRRRGGLRGHPGRSRSVPHKPDRARHQRLKSYPDCGTKLRPTAAVSGRTQEEVDTTTVEND